MKTILAKYNSFLSIITYLLLFTLTLSWYRFSFDVDATAYITIAKQIANRQWFRSINGLWSPLNCWIAGLFINAGINPIIIFKIINAVVCCGIILLCGILIKKFLKNIYLQSSILFALAIILLSYTQQQLAGDLLQLFFFLIYINIITSSDFFKYPKLNYWCALIMSLAYLAKSYSLPFFIVFHLSIYLLYYRMHRGELVLSSVIKSVSATYAIFFLLISPWIYCLFLKYHHFTFSNAGILNYNWYLGNTSVTLKDTGLLVPPPYSNSFNYWEDPFPYYHSFYGPLSSLYNFLKACKLTLHNIKESIGLFMEMSFCLLAIFVYWIIRVVKSKTKEKLFPEVLLITAGIILTLGYLLIHIETRYIWFTGIAGLILGAKILEEKIFPYLANSKISFIIGLLFFTSFIISPADKLQDLKDKGKDLNEAKMFLDAQSVTGRFTANYTGVENSWCTKLAFLSNNQFYLLAKSTYSSEELLSAIEMHKINFYLYFYHSPIEKENFYSGPLAKASRKIIAVPGKDILLVLFQ